MKVVGLSKRDAESLIDFIDDVVSHSRAVSEIAEAEVPYGNFKFDRRALKTGKFSNEVRLFLKQISSIDKNAMITTSPLVELGEHGDDAVIGIRFAYRVQKLMGVRRRLFDSLDTEGSIALKNAFYLSSTALWRPTMGKGRRQELPIPPAGLKRKILQKFAKGQTVDAKLYGAKAKYVRNEIRDLKARIQHGFGIARDAFIPDASSSGGIYRLANDVSLTIAEPE